MDSALKLFDANCPNNDGIAKWGLIGVHWGGKTKSIFLFFIFTSL